MSTVNGNMELNHVYTTDSLVAYVVTGCRVMWGLTVYEGAPSGEPLLKPLGSIRVPAGQKKKNHTNTAAISKNASATTLFTR